MHELEQIAVEVARKCGRLIVDERPAKVEVADTKSSETDVVTALDSKSEALAKELLNKLRPDDGLFGEEGLDITTKSGITWVIDPIDGTVNYLYDIPAYAVSVAAVEGDPRSTGWRPVAGAVYNPKLDELFHAHAGGGARLSVGGNTREVHFQAADNLAKTLMATGFAYSAEKRRWEGAILAELITQVRDVRRGGSAALDLANLTIGRHDLYYEHGLNPWDYAAGWLVATEAGAQVKIIPNPDPEKELVIAGKPEIVGQIAELVAAARQKFSK